MELFPPRYRKMWKEWDLRVAVLMSLTLQIVLIILGNRRKYNQKLWVRVVVWSAYLAADSVATFALGLLSNNLSDMFDTRSLDANSALTSFWAPFLLLHLGGPDTITAYALEDNELWLRHFLGLIVQTGIALYVFLMSWTGSRLSILCNIMLFTGLIKYGERTWVLRSASYEKFRESMVTSGTRYRNFSSSTDEEFAKTSEGYYVHQDWVSEVRLPVDPSIFNNNSLCDQDKLVAGHGLLNITKRLFVDAILNSNDKDTSNTVFRHMSSENVFEVIEIELGWMYDILHTKSMLLYTRWGITLRLIAVFLTCLVLVLFIFLDHKYQYSKIDLLITLLLLIVAIGLEVYAALVMISSEQFFVWLNMHRKTSILQVITSFPFLKRPRWSNKMSQFSMLSLSMKERSLPCHNILNLLTIDRQLEKRWYIGYKEVPVDLKKLVIRYVKVRNARRTMYNEEELFAFLPGASGRLKFWTYMMPHYDLTPGKNILFWHIVTEVSYYLDIKDIKQQSKIDAKHCKFIKWISRYMLSLLVMHPSMLSAELTTEISFQETVDETVNVLRGSQVCNSKTEACKKLIEWFDQDPGFREESDSSELHNALRIVRDFTSTEQDKIEKWNKIGWTWLGILANVASRCKGNLHAQQLRRGGEFLSHVWLLMAHYGMTDHFQISVPYTPVRVVAR